MSRSQKAKYFCNANSSQSIQAPFCMSWGNHDIRRFEYSKRHIFLLNFTFCIFHLLNIFSNCTTNIAAIKMRIHRLFPEILQKTAQICLYRRGNSGQTTVSKMRYRGPNGEGAISCRDFCAVLSDDSNLCTISRFLSEFWCGQFTIVSALRHR